MHFLTDAQLLLSILIAIGIIAIFIWQINFRSSKYYYQKGVESAKEQDFEKAVRFLRKSVLKERNNRKYLQSYIGSLKKRDGEFEDAVLSIIDDKSFKKDQVLLKNFAIELLKVVIDAKDFKQGKEIVEFYTIFYIDEFQVDNEIKFLKGFIYYYNADWGDKSTAKDLFREAANNGHKESAEFLNKMRTLSNKKLLKWGFRFIRILTI